MFASLVLVPGPYSPISLPYTARLGPPPARLASATPWLSPSPATGTQYSASGRSRLVEAPAPCRGRTAGRRISCQGKAALASIGLSGADGTGGRTPPLIATPPPPKGPSAPLGRPGHSGRRRLGPWACPQRHRITLRGQLRAWAERGARDAPRETFPRARIQKRQSARAFADNEPLPGNFDSKPVRRVCKRGTPMATEPAEAL